MRMIIYSDIYTIASLQDCSGLLIRDSFGVFVLQARSIPPFLWLRKRWMKVTAASLDFKVQAKPGLRELLRQLESMRMLEGPLKISFLPQMKVRKFSVCFCH